MIYNELLECVPCSRELKGCAICTSSESCTECVDTTQKPLSIINSEGVSDLQCSAGIQVFANCDLSVKMIELCPNCTDSSNTLCNDCIKANLTDYYTISAASELTTACTNCDLTKYLQDINATALNPATPVSTSQCTSECINLITQDLLGCNCQDPFCKVCYQ